MQKINLYRYKIIQRHMTQPVIGDLWYAPATGIKIEITRILKNSMICVSIGGPYSEIFISRREWQGYYVVPIKLVSEQAIGSARIGDLSVKYKTERDLIDAKADPKSGDEFLIKSFSCQKNPDKIVITEVASDLIRYYKDGIPKSILKKDFYSYMTSLHEVKYEGNQLL